ncbi:MAG: chemotaxis protein CheX [Firmicutes bacterium]|nr:chemotaxis protein CheX [Bacillota bacterium]
MAPPSADMEAILRRALDHSAEALSGFLGTKLARAADVQLSRHRLADLPVLCGPEETPVAGVFLEVQGDLHGYLLLVIPAEEARDMESKLLAVAGTEDPEGTGELADSALGELGNVVGSAFLNELADRFHLSVTPSPPQVARDMVGALLSTLAGALAVEERTELPVVRTELVSDVSRLAAYLLWIPGGTDWNRLEAMA